MQALYVLVLIATSALGAGSAEAQRQLWLHKPEIADLSTAFEGSEQGHSAAGASLGWVPCVVWRRPSIHSLCALLIRSGWIVMFGLQCTACARALVLIYSFAEAAVKETVSSHLTTAYVALWPVRRLTGISSNQAEQQPINSLESVQAATAATGSAGNWRGVRHRAFGQARKLLTGFSSTVIQVAYSNTTARCPSSTDDWAEIPGFGHLVSDNWVCSNPAPPAQVRPDYIIQTQQLVRP